ncbi:hypothetical protein [Nocardioides solisilvae]|uniref:hypothetical protein n=1 Tax=Nocardioides solisilvae TaxID=1542435 RepID=UPI00194DDDD7|nr:hypothetical protein [Nocardioides solisilvae]
MSELIVPHRFCGPARSGNGGWTAGELAAHVEHGCPEDRSEAWPPIRVRLRMPPPLDQVLTVVEEADAGAGGVLVTRLLDPAGALVADAVLVDEAEPDHALVAVAPVAPEVARAAETAYEGLTDHPFPRCFTCGPDREPGDGLRIFPGPVAGGDDPAQGPGRRVAATWTPHPSLAEDWHAYVDGAQRTGLAATWAALDCPGAWGAGMEGRSMVLGTMTARVDALPVVGEEHVVVGEGRRTEGRRTWTASTLYDPDGRVVAVAEHVWVTVDPEVFA